VLTPGGAGTQSIAGELCFESEAADMDLRAVLMIACREHCQPAAGARDAAEDGDERAAAWVRCA